MDQVRDLLDKITELSAEQLDELETSILSEFDTIEKAELSRASVDTMNELAAAADTLKGERTRRETEAAELSAARDEAVSRIRGSEPDAEAPAEAEENEPDVIEADEVVPEEDEEKRDDVTAASVTDVEPASNPVTELSTLSGDQPAVQPAADKDVPEVGSPDEEIPEQLTGEPVQKHPEADSVVQEKDVVESNTDPVADIAVEDGGDDTPATNTEDDSEEEAMTAAAPLEVPADRRPVVKHTAPVTIVAGGDIQGVAAGAELPNMRAVADAIIKRSHSMRKTTGGDGEQQTIATLVASFPEDRVLSTANTAEANYNRISAVTSPEALTAAGGLCAPVEVSYDIFGLEGSTARPVRDALAVFSADRGGIRFVTPPVLADLDGSVSVWTLQDDIDAATAGAPDPVKPCLRVNCGSEVTVYTDAIPLCLTFGNLGARAWPELVERHLELAMVWHARFAEQRLITRIGSLSKSVTAAAQLGAARDFFVQLEAASAGYRNRYRMDSQAPLRVILPEWFRNALRADMVKQLPGDGAENTFGLADTFMNNWFSVRHINVSWHMDGESGQILANQAGAGAALNGFPSTLIWYLFAEGTFLFLDGGTLDLGLVRDSLLNGTNDYKIFLETFEGVAKVGVESLRISSTLKIAGAAAATVATI